MPERYKECGLELERRVNRRLVLLGIGLIIDKSLVDGEICVGDNGVFVKERGAPELFLAGSSSWHAKA